MVDYSSLQYLIILKFWFKFFLVKKQLSMWNDTHAKLLDLSIFWCMHVSRRHVYVMETDGFWLVSYQWWKTNENENGTQETWWLCRKPLWPIPSWTPKDPGMGFILPRCPIFPEVGWHPHQWKWMGRERRGIKQWLLRRRWSHLTTLLWNVFLKTSQKYPGPRQPPWMGLSPCMMEDRGSSPFRDASCPSQGQTFSWVYTVGGLAIA